ncbi:hypothetical protein BaRGS_00005862, partial [Batillaria attramentaria]
PGSRDNNRTFCNLSPYEQERDGERGGKAQKPDHIESVPTAKQTAVPLSMPTGGQLVMALSWIESQSLLVFSAVLRPAACVLISRHTS